MDEKYLHINVYDDDFGKDNIQGCYSLPVEVALHKLTSEKMWFDLIGCQSGKIQLSATFSKVVLEDSSTEKPIIEAAESESNLEKAEKIVSLPSFDVSWVTLIYIDALTTLVNR